MTTPYIISDPNFSQFASFITADGLTVSQPSFSIEYQAIGNSPQSSGSYYFEAMITTPFYYDPASVGLISTSVDKALNRSSYDVLASTNATGGVLLISNGDAMCNGAYNPTNFTNIGGLVYQGSVFAVAVDLDSKLVWLGQPGGYWNGSSSADPVARTGGIDISGLTMPLVPVISFPYASGAVTFNFGNNPNPIWDKNSPQYGGDWTYTQNLQSFSHASFYEDADQIKSTSFVNVTGSSYFELVCTLPQATGGYCAGVVLANYSGGNISSNPTTSTGCAWVNESGAIYTNSVSSGITLAPITTGTVIRVYLDGNGNIAFAINNGLWNGSYTDSQIASGTGLLALNFSGAMKPFVSFESQTYRYDTSIWEINASFQQCAYPAVGTAYLTVPYTGVPPSGYANWPAAAPIGVKASQTGLDVLKSNTASNVRVSYDSLEVLNARTSSNVRVSYDSLESLVLMNNTNARVSQTVLQVLTPVIPPPANTPTNIMIL